jgi:hypothetical protein
MIKNNLPKKTTLSILLIMFFMFSGYSSSELYAQNQAEVYPKIKGFVGILHPIVTFTAKETTLNFEDYYIVGVPIGINIWKNKKIGFSFEIVPTIKSDKEISKVNNILIHPGVLIRLKHEFTFAGRIAFETSGRYGFTPILSKAIGIHNDYNYYVSVPVPVRFGNDKDASVTVGFQFGIAF